MDSLNSHPLSRDGCYLGNCKESIIFFAYRTITFYGWAFLHHSAKNYICNFPDSPCPAYYNPHDPDCATHKGLTHNRFGLLPFRSPLLRKSIFFFSRSYWDVSLLSVIFDILYIQIPILRHKPTVGFPIRKSPAQSLFDSSPKLIAVFHVLLRLSAPRHPPCTLCSLTIYVILYVQRGSNCYPLSIHFSKNNTLNHTLNLYHNLKWWRWAGSNRQPLPCKGSALPVELHPL